MGVGHKLDFLYQKIVIPDYSVTLLYKLILLPWELWGTDIDTDIQTYRRKGSCVCISNDTSCFV